eukprot:COSAG01_NODE_7466_length_3199_cov_3.514839_2_plen_184_part_00
MAGDSGDGGVPTRVIEEAVKAVLPAGARALTTSRLERRLAAVPKRLLTCAKMEDGTCRWRLSHDSIRRWLAGADARVPLSAAHGHQMLAGRLACRLAVASLQPALSQWLVQPRSPRREAAGDAAGVDPAQVLQLATHIDCANAQAGLSYASATHASESGAGRGGVAILRALGPEIIGGEISMS